MKRRNHEGLAYNEYKVVIQPPYSDAYEGIINAPADMRFYNVGVSNVIEYCGVKYETSSWIGVTKYSKEKEDISHNMQESITTPTYKYETNYPCVSCMSMSVLNIFDRYLIWELKEVALHIDDADSFPTTDKLEMFDEPIYAIRYREDSDNAYILLKETEVVDKDKLVEIARMLEVPYSAIKIFGPSRSGGLDATNVLFRCKGDVAKIERINIPFTPLEFDAIFGDVVETTKEVYDAYFNNVYQKILGENF